MKSASKNWTLLNTLAAGATTFILGCVITLGPSDRDPNQTGECGNNSALENDGKCYCIDNYDWCSDNESDLDCCPSGSGTTNDPTNATTGETEGTGSETGGETEGTTDTTGTETETEGTTDDPTAGPSCDDAMPPPDGPCDPETELAYCTHPDTCGPQGSEYYECIDGMWTLIDSTGADSLCQFDGFDFSYGCVDDGMQVFLECGYGSGAPCTEDACADMDTLEACIHGKATAQSCQETCAEDFFDYGECGDQGMGPECLCYNEGEVDTDTTDSGGETDTDTDTDTDTTG